MKKLGILVAACLTLITSNANAFLGIPCDWYECGEWFPDKPPLYRGFAADPREVIFSAGWRFNDEALEAHNIDVSYCNYIGGYRWYGVGPCDGQLEIGVEGCLWAVFDPCHDSAPLVNADYYVGFPITYAFGPWAFRLRGYHISSHIGDEFLLNHPDFDRRNPSAEYLEFSASYDITRDITLYSSLGWIVSQDASFDLGKAYAQAGAEVHIPWLTFYDECNRIYGSPIFGMNFYINNHYTRHINSTYILGYEFMKCAEQWHKIRIFAEYHDGYSLEGQFRCLPTNYFSLRLTYGY